MTIKYIYVICEGTLAPNVKIGFSANPQRRLKQLQTGHPNTLELFHKEEVPEEKVRAIERVIHKTLAHLRKSGEWFTLTPADAVAEIKHAMIRYGDLEYLTERVRQNYFD